MENFRGVLNHLDESPLMLRCTLAYYERQRVSTDVKAADLEAMLDHLKLGDEERKAVDPFTADKYCTSVKAAFNWGLKHPSPTPLLPANFRPFVSIEKYKRPAEAITEADLLTPDEIDALLKVADDDLGQVIRNGKFASRQPSELRIGNDNPYFGFRDILCAYHATGARTSELASATVGDFSRTTRQIILRKHKRSHTLRNGTARRITVNDEVAEILDRRCADKARQEPIFVDPQGRPWNRHRLDNRFQRVRDRAGVRSEVTIYSFRHLWISEALMSGVDVATVSKMAGTSIAMIERVYGHFRSDHLREAQARLDAARRQQRARSSPEDNAA